MHIRRPGERLVFIDDGGTNWSNWVVFHDEERWWDPPSLRHGNGTNFSFADGHSEYWKWKDKRTIEFGITMDRYLRPLSPGNPDLHRVQRAIWRG